MSSPSRMLAILDLFSQQHPVWHPDRINEALGYSRATGYRYVKDLVEAGLLQKVSAGHYALGARIIELDYQLRTTDPVLLAAVPVMEALSQRTGLDVVLSAMFGHSQVVDIHRASADGALQLQYGRGRPRPLFRGAAPKAILSALPRAQLRRLYDAHSQAAREAGLGESWEAFRTHMARLREAGLCLSIGELDEGVGAAAVAVHSDEDEVVAALALVGTVERLQALPHATLRQWLDEAAQAIRDQLGTRTPGGA